LALRDELKKLGAIIAWHDPLVPLWEGSEPVDLEWECDVAILATNQPGMDLRQMITRGVRILDCTNSISEQAGVSSL
jgi:UDP-N-acetyl-D-glucosamine dehydrogenase